MSDRPTIGFVGLGSFGPGADHREIVRYFERLPGVEVVSAGDHG